MRPEGWEETVNRIKDNFHPLTSQEAFDFGLQCIEAGADAMLKGLMSGVRYRVVAEYVDGKEMTIDSKNGYLVFISEED